MPHAVTINYQLFPIKKALFSGNRKMEKVWEMNSTFPFSANVDE